MLREHRSKQCFLGQVEILFAVSVAAIQWLLGRTSMTLKVTAWREPLKNPSYPFTLISAVNLNKKMEGRRKGFTLQPIDLPRVLASGRLPHQQGTQTRHTAKPELEKKMQTPVYTSGKRQYFHKLQMLEMNRKRQEAQLELKKRLHRGAKVNKQKLRDHKAKKSFHSLPRNDNCGILTMLPDETMNRSLGNSQDAELLEGQARNEYCPWKMGKLEMWFHEQESHGQLLWDSSSSDSEQPGRDEKKPQPLVRTRTERLPLFDEFFDQK
ncbi:uncharacterized protein CCDC198 isoform X3 [Octodon degus]|uniref:Uncharacterized protein CCDC198 isoform X3 n=1 Tax=Octodon degus TaxID=10160 RepID=A0A6P6DFM7_OCTDE|nr:uncharacterized protein CCDC198 isoform X3 [Octodon degus]